MALGHGAKIVKNGLVFAYDMGPNPGANKSWKGKPTTNLHTNTDTLSGWYFVDSSYSNGRLIAGTGSAAHFVLQDKSVVSGTVYTQSVEVKYDGVRYFQIAPSTGFSSNFAAFDLVDGTVAGGNTSAASIVDIGNGYYRCSYTATATSTTSSGRMAFGPNESSTSRLAQWVGNGANGVFLRNPQIEANSFATPFVNGTRSNTEALLDWAGNNTITAASLTYNSDGTFSFASSLLDTTIGSGRNVASNPITIQAFVKSNTTSGARIWVDATSNGTNQRLYSGLNAVGQSSGMGIQGSAWSSSVPIDTNWHYQAIVLDGSTATAYDNGVVASSKAYTSYTLPGNIIVGGRSGYYWSGEISAFSVYDRALTASEIQQNFNALRGRYGI